MLTKPQIKLLKQAKEHHLCLSGLSARDLVSVVALERKGCLSRRTTLNTCKFRITRLGQERLAFETSSRPSHEQIVESLRGELSRLRLRQTLDLRYTRYDR